MPGLKIMPARSISLRVADGREIERVCRLQSHLYMHIVVLRACYTLCVSMCGAGGFFGGGLVVRVCVGSVVFVWSCLDSVVFFICAASGILPRPQVATPRCKAILLTLVKTR